jgi:hypothetical protein
MTRISSFVAAAMIVCLAATVDAATLRGVIPVAGSTGGAFGSNFRTSLQLANRTDRVQAGRLVFHPAGASASETDPSLPYTLEPHQTIGYDDVVAAMGVTGLGSIDLLVDEGGVPAIVARAYDDKVDLGTVGTSVSLVATTDALAAGDTTSLVVPRDLDRFRFNIGVRTLDQGATILMKVYDSSGIEHDVIGPMTLAPSYFVQRPAAEFVGVALKASDAVAITVVEGSVIVYGTVTDNTTNDPSIHIATRE